MKQEPSTPPAERLYPELEMVGKQFRLERVCEIQRQLEGERDYRAALYKRYKRGVNAADGVDSALVTASLGAGAAGIGLLTTVVAVPIVIGLEIGAVAAGLLGIGSKYVGRRLLAKARKHDDIRVLAESKLNTINDHISRALKDNAISDEEFRLISDELEKYHEMKKDIRAQAAKAHASVAIDEAEKKRLIAHGREEAREELRKAMGGN